MKILQIICASAITLTAFASTANAATFRPSGARVYSGAVTATVAGIPSSCLLSMTVSAGANAAGDGHTTFAHALGTDPNHSHGTPSTNELQVTSFTLSPGSAGCTAATLHSLPYKGTYNPSTNVITVNGVNATAIGGLVNCSGNIQGTYDHTNKTVTFTNQTIGLCTFNGTVSNAHDIDTTP